MMSAKERKPCQDLPPDVLSNLPDSVIDVILMCMPCRDAVRTSILSKSWRYSWCRRTEFKLDDWALLKKDLVYPIIELTDFINQLVTFHEGPVTKFTLEIDSGVNHTEIDDLIYFLSRNDIQHLVLRLPWDDLYELPYSLFTCSQLRHLALSHCSIHPPSAFKGFDRLISLELCGVEASSEFLRNLISRCPMLVQLVLNISEVLDVIDINAPMLRFFDFEGNISSISLKNVPLLANISLVCHRLSLEAENYGFAKFFESCFALEHLSIKYNFFEFGYFEPHGDVAIRLPFDLNRVKRFYLPGIMLDVHQTSSYQLSSALCLIRSFPYLEYLEIEISNDYNIGALKCLKMKRCSDVAFSHLVEIKLESFTGTKPEMQLIKLLLAKSPVLMTMQINVACLYDGDDDERKEILAKLSKFQRASPEAVVVYTVM